MPALATHFARGVSDLPGPRGSREAGAFDWAASEVHAHAGSPSNAETAPRWQEVSIAAGDMIYPRHINYLINDAAHVEFSRLSRGEMTCVADVNTVEKQAT